VQDEVLVRVVNGRAHLLKKSEAGGDVEPLPVAVLRDRLPVDVFYHEIRQLSVRYAAVEELGDVRVIERREDLTLGSEALVQLIGVPARAQHFHGGAAPELAVVALGEVHDAHPAAAELTRHAVWSDPPPSRKVRAHGGDVGRGRDVQRALLLVSSQKELDLASQRHVIATPHVEPGGAAIFRNVESVVEDRVDRAVTIRRMIGGIRVWR